MTNPSPDFEVLHYIGYDDDRGGIVSVIRALAATNQFRCVLGVNEGFQGGRAKELSVQRFTPVTGEQLSLRTFWQSRRVAGEVKAWLDAGPARIFHGHSRAGLVVALWLRWMRQHRVVASVHCYGKHRWFYRVAARRLGERLYWLSPAMKRYYGVDPAGESWRQCIPGCVADPILARSEPRRANDGIVRLGGIGALVSWKRWHLVLAALSAVPPPTREKLRFVHIGGDDGSPRSKRYAAALQADTQARGLGDLVTWRGEQPSARTLLGEIDCLVVASHREPFSVAMLEALFAGVPVVAANSGGARDIVSPGTNGWLFRSGDPRDLGRTFAMLAESDALSLVRIDSRALARFSAVSVAREWTEVYRRVAG